MIAAFDGVFRKRVCRRLGGLVQVLAGVLVLASVGVGMAATAPGVSDWHPASGAMASDAAAEAVMVQAAAPDANTQRLVFRFPSVVLGRGADGLLDVSLPSTGQWRQPGEPVLPMISTRVALPQGHVLVSFTVVPSDASETVLDAPVRHAQRPFPLSRPQDRVATPASAAIYGADSPYPAALHTDGSVQTKRGVGFVDLALFPVSYRPASGRLTAYGTLTLEVVTKAVKPSGLAVSSADAGWRARLRSVDDLALLQSLVENPQALASYQPKETSDAGVVSLASAADPGQPSLPCHLGDLSSMSSSPPATFATGLWRRVQRLPRSSLSTRIFSSIRMRGPNGHSIRRPWPMPAGIPWRSGMNWSRSLLTVGWTRWE